MAYFQRWWDRLPESRRDEVRMLYKRGQLEFNLGARTLARSRSCGAEITLLTAAACLRRVRQAASR
jgi:hypothetical protein